MLVCVRCFQLGNSILLVEVRLCSLLLIHFNIHPYRAGSSETVLENSTTEQPSVIPSQDSLIADLLSMDINAPTIPAQPNANVFSTPSSVDLLGGGLDSLVIFTNTLQNTF